MKKKFSDNLQALWESAQLFIESAINEGETISLKPMEDEEDDFTASWLYDLPSVNTVGKYGNYNEYAVLSVSKEKGAIMLHTQERGEICDNADFSLSEIDYSNICFLADEINRVKETVPA